MRIPAMSRLSEVAAVILIPTMLILPTVSLAGERFVGAKMSIDSGGKVQVNNVTVYNPDEGTLYADSGQIATDAIVTDDDEAWYEPSAVKFLVGLVAIGACVGIAFIVDNNIDDDRYEWYYDSDCDCYKRRKVD